jgi:hypothetical protein
LTLNLKVFLPIVIICVALATLFVVFQGELVSKNSAATSKESDNVDSFELVLTETDGVKHLIPLDKIRGGGPPKDGIPSIDNPIFVGVDESRFMSDSDTIVGVEINGETMAYPIFILVWH